MPEVLHEPDFQSLVDQAGMLIASGRFDSINPTPFFPRQTYDRVDQICANGSAEKIAERSLWTLNFSPGFVHGRTYQKVHYTPKGAPVTTVNWIREGFALRDICVTHEHGSPNLQMFPEQEKLGVTIHDSQSAVVNTYTTSENAIVCASINNWRSLAEFLATSAMAIHRGQNPNSSELDTATEKSQFLIFYLGLKHSAENLGIASRGGLLRHNLMNLAAGVTGVPYRLSAGVQNAQALIEARKTIREAPSYKNIKLRGMELWNQAFDAQDFASLIKLLDYTGEHTHKVLHRVFTVCSQMKDGLLLSKALDHHILVSLISHRLNLQSLMGLELAEMDAALESMR